MSDALKLDGAQDDAGRLTEVDSSLVVNTRLFKHFTPDVAEELCALPSQVFFPKAALILRQKKQNQKHLFLLLLP